MVGNEVRSSFSSKVIPLSKTIKVRKSQFFAPKTEVFLVVAVTASNSCSHRCFCCDADRAGRPVAKEARELQRRRSRLKQRYQTMPDNLCTFHLFWLLPPCLSSSFPHSTLAPPSPLLFFLGPSFSSSSSFSFFSSHTHTPSFLASLL